MDMGKNGGGVRIELMWGCKRDIGVTTTELVRAVGLEPTASASQAQRSSHLNYILRELLDGIEPPNNRLQNGSCSSEA